MRAAALLSVLSAVSVAIFGCGPQENPEAPDTDVTAEATEAISPAEALLARSIAYHDPDHAWPSFRGSLELDEIRPNGASRGATVGLDVSTSAFRYETSIDGQAILKEVTPEGCKATVDEAEPDAAQVEALRLECSQIERSRNYYLYLWGLPMKLRDPGTHVDPSVVSTEFQGETVYQLRVTYDAEVGGDTWYFYFSRETAEMVGYRFYHDESANDGEYITLEGETTIGTLRLPARRRWFVNADDRFLGEDVLLGSGPF